MPQRSAGLLMCRIMNSLPEFFLVHPGGPYYVKKDAGYWSIPKGLVDENEELLTAAKREFFEETGITPVEPFFSLETVKSKSGKLVYAWSFLGEWDEKDGIISNTFEMEWPPRSQKRIEVPEVDRAAWLGYETAAMLIQPAQLPFLEKARKHYTVGPADQAK